MSLIGDKHSKEAAEKAARQKELAKVTIKKDDVELIVSINLCYLNIYDNMAYILCLNVVTTKGS